MGDGHPSEGLRVEQREEPVFLERRSSGERGRKRVEPDLAAALKGEPADVLARVPTPDCPHERVLSVFGEIEGANVVAQVTVNPAGMAPVELVDPLEGPEWHAYWSRRGTASTHDGSSCASEPDAARTPLASSRA